MKSFNVGYCFMDEMNFVCSDETQFDINMNQESQDVLYDFVSLWDRYKYENGIETATVSYVEEVPYINYEEEDEE